MNFLRQNSVNKLRILAQIGSRAITTAPPPLVSAHQPAHPVAIAIRLTDQPADPITRYDISPPVNWGYLTVSDMNTCIIERFGKYAKTLTKGAHYLIPFVDRIAYVHSLKEQALCFPYQHAITKDNVLIVFDGIMYVKIVDPLLASYGVLNPLNSAIQLAIVVVQTEIGKIVGKNIYVEYSTLHEKTMISINKVIKDWGLECIRCEIMSMEKVTMETEAGKVLSDGCWFKNCRGPC
ncbi:hypothetical protein ABFS82_06G092600 [Erythranthe guttata]|nr:PREDICTED: uncharacterized protein C16G5.07c-like [Erythranthe guttata]|eukprot:XP_012858182.1 PREDICTED: uncharacterized protein C16G5.07c-like [Erythranthe guttata]